MVLHCRNPGDAFCPQILFAKPAGYLAPRLRAVAKTDQSIQPCLANAASEAPLPTHPQCRLAERYAWTEQNLPKQEKWLDKPNGFRVESKSLCDRLYAPVAQLDRASDFESAGRRFESCRAYHFWPEKQICGPLAQLVEQLTLNQEVRGSSP